MTKGWKIGLGVFAAILVVGAIQSQNKKAEENTNVSGVAVAKVEEPSAAKAAASATDTTGPKADTPAKAAVPEPAGVTMAGYQQLRTGMTYRQVVAILGEEGEELSSNEIGGIRTAMYSWSRFTGANMNVMFQDGRMIQKAQFGLR